MDQMRLILAVLAALLALVFVAVWFAKGRLHSTRGRGAILFYAIMLFASSGVLFLKSRDEGVPQFEQPIVKHEQTQNTELDQLNSDSDRVVSQRPAQPKQEQLATWTKAKVVTPGSVRSNKNVVSHPLQLHNNSDLPTSTLPLNDKPVEDVIEAGILQAFDVIEVFFESYGTPVVTSSSLGSKSSPASIEFVTGSAELSLRSVQYLRIVAAELCQKYKDGQLEIRAQTDETVYSPELRRQLTQSRAEAVRDVLSLQGFPVERMVPIGSERAGETRVKFVHRPN
ncbi:MAG: hypothetical protein IPP40_02455 [bacterium]|nr:hypothetical protein [bacterium]